MVKLDSQYIIYLINFRAAINLILLEYITKKKFELILKKEPYVLNFADKKAIQY